MQLLDMWVLQILQMQIVNSSISDRRIFGKKENMRVKASLIRMSSMAKSSKFSEI